MPSNALCPWPERPQLSFPLSLRSYVLPFFFLKTPLIFPNKFSQLWDSSMISKVFTLYLRRMERERGLHICDQLKKGNSFFCHHYLLFESLIRSPCRLSAYFMIPKTTTHQCWIPSLLEQVFSYIGAGLESLYATLSISTCFLYMPLTELSINSRVLTSRGE